MCGLRIVFGTRLFGCRLQAAREMLRQTSSDWEQTTDIVPISSGRSFNSLQMLQKCGFDPVIPTLVADKADRVQVA